MSIIRIQHIRRINPLGGVEQKGGMTIAYTYDFNRYGNGKGDSTIRVATALCSNNDTFSRAAGRRLALSSFEAGHTILLPVLDRDPQTLMGLFRVLLSAELIFDMEEHSEDAVVSDFHNRVSAEVEKLDSPNYRQHSLSLNHQSPDCCGESRTAYEDHGVMTLKIPG